MCIAQRTSIVGNRSLQASRGRKRMNCVVAMAWTLPALLLVTASHAEPSTVIKLTPGDNVAEAVERASEGVTFQLAPGLYRLQFARPKDGQKFIGQGEVVFSGATVLSDWNRVDRVWVAVGPEWRGRPSGKCRDDVPLCNYGEDLFVDGKIFRRVASLAEVRPGTYYDDRRNIHIVDDPAGKLIEFGTIPFAFAGEAKGVVLENIVVEKYASPAQRGAIDFPKGSNWTLRNVVARWNHGIGVRIGHGAQISGGSFSNNGQLGMGGGAGAGILIENVEIAHNNYAGFRIGWEAGGTKFVRVNGLIVRNSCIHNNDGPGLWTDVDNIDVQFSNNWVFDNRGDGIKHEISYRAKIFGNTVSRNGHEKLNWLWRSQILIQNSQDVEVYDNIVEVRPDYGNGISVINQKRGEGQHGPWVARNNFVHDNTIIHLGASGMSGIVADHDKEWFYGQAGNAFDRNAYVVPNDKRGYFAVRDGRQRFAKLADFAMERQAKVEFATRRPLRVVCGQPVRLD